MVELGLPDKSVILTLLLLQLVILGVIFVDGFIKLVKFLIYQRLHLLVQLLVVVTFCRSLVISRFFLGRLLLVEHLLHDVGPTLRMRLW